MRKEIQIITAASILGLKPSGVEKLPESLLSNGLPQKLNSPNPVIQLPTLNHFYSFKRDETTHLLNGGKLREFSISVHQAVSEVLKTEKFPLVLGGDCSIIIGIMSALKARETCGLFFLDAHADFYEPEKSVTGEVADMDLAIVTGRGPDRLTNIYNDKPYLKDKHVIHIGQRDMEETRKYGSQDIKETSIKCFDWPGIRDKGIKETIDLILEHAGRLKVGGFWLHFDTDVLSDDVNPAVDYRLPGGLSFEQCEELMGSLLHYEKIIGLSVTIFNPRLDKEGKISVRLTECIARVFE